MSEKDTAEQLCDRLNTEYAADCKFCECQIVPVDLIEKAVVEIRWLKRALGSARHYIDGTRDDSGHKKTVLAQIDAATTFAKVEL